MITVEEALVLVRGRIRSKPPVTVALADALGLVLAEDVASDVDSPPFDKSIVDGYAIVADDLRDGVARLAILEEVTAGAVPRATVVPGSTTRLMTGAPIPPGADTVVMIERSEIVSDRGGRDMVLLRDANIRAGRNILGRGSAMRAGEVVLRREARLRPVEIGLLAEIGRTQVEVVPRPTVAILPTGNELVEPDEQPSPGQIRNSNGPMLAAVVRQAGAEPIALAVARDDETDLRQKISAGLAADVLLLSGGVSAGVLDLVPKVLVELGAEEVFHKVSVKPGKPLWFGVARRDGRETLIFGLPGNPVSTFVCFELFVRPAIEGLSGRSGCGLSRAAPTRMRASPAWRQADIFSRGSLYREKWRVTGPAGRVAWFGRSPWSGRGQRASGI